jgi:hypothetical protein
VAAGLAMFDEVLLASLRYQIDTMAVHILAGLSARHQRDGSTRNVEILNLARLLWMRKEHKINTLLHHYADLGCFRCARVGYEDTYSMEQSLLQKALNEVVYNSMQPTS